MLPRQSRFLFAGAICILALLLGVGWLAASPTPALAGEEPPAYSVQSAPAAQDDPNAACYSCHTQEGMQTTLPSGEILFLTVDPEVYNNSVHGNRGNTCVSCHTDISGFPHPENTAQTYREYQLEQYNACANCHQDYFSQVKDSVHQVALDSGNQKAATCIDCHGAHNVQNPSTPLSNIPKTCQKCHSGIYNQYTDSVHGAALIGEGNADVPTCTTCHGVHDIEGPSINSEFKIRSPLICAECHANEELMTKYGVNTQVFDTYLSDFHGSTTLLFVTTAEGQEVNTPVCIDCHGVHDISASDDPEKSLAVKENLLQKCQRCHPDASTNFPDAWLGHYTPSAEKYPIVYFVDLFYKLFVPGVLGFMVIFVATDLFRKFYKPSKSEEDHSETTSEGENHE